MAKIDEVKKLVHENKNGFSKISEKEKKEVFEFCEEYRKFISVAKTERLVCNEAKCILESNGFKPLESAKKLSAGDKVYTINRGKGILAAVIGSEDIENGVNLVGAHIDAPRLDLKPRPLYEDSELAFFKTHYYGGIKKYQWTTIPLAIHGVVALQDGTQIDISIGEDKADPVFVISDLLPHLAVEQMQKKLSEAISGEALNIILGNISIEGDDISDGVKLNILKLLNEKYGICEEDLISSEIEIVPAFDARDAGLDRSMVAGYGQDDRVCAYAALRAILDVKKPTKTAITLLVDKEEIGSMGNTGMKSRYFENVLAEIAYLKEGTDSALAIRRALSNSACLSADVGAALDPNYPDVTEKKNGAFLNHGILLTKYTGSRGKSGASDANAEFVSEIRRIFNENQVVWQIAELGKVDVGGGGTIAQYVANLDMEVIDVGVPLLSMHSPFEIAGKIDIYMAFKGYRAFLKG